MWQADIHNEPSSIGQDRLQPARLICPEVALCSLRNFLVW